MLFNDALDFGGWNLPPNRLLHQIAQVGGFFDAHSRGSSQMKFETAAVQLGKKSCPAKESELPARPRQKAKNAIRKTRR